MTESPQPDPERVALVVDRILPVLVGYRPAYQIAALVELLARLQRGENPREADE
jgi:hypothetical protein